MADVADFTHSDFARLKSSDESLEKQFGRFEGKLDELNRAVSRIVVFEERQAIQTDNLKAFNNQLSEIRVELANRTASIGERFDKKLGVLEEKHLALATKVDGFLQRYVGVSAAIAVAWAVAFHFYKRG